MVSNMQDTNNIQKITICSLITSVYMCGVVGVLLYYKNLYNIGKVSTLSVLAVIIIAECFKLIISCQSQNTTKSRDKINKQKYYFKNKIKSLFVIAITISVYYIIAVLFGAPFLSNHEETLMFSLLLTTLTTLPSCLNVGADATISILMGLTTSQDNLLCDTIRKSICLTLFGAWLGAVVIPLDWDRPWQIWPIPCSLGGIIGYTLFQLVMLVKFIPRYIKTFVKKTGKYGL